jgi:RNA 3'-terminal phosphate cyclase (ATP)
MITLDGAQGEGGGQVLRSALALSILTGTPVTLRNIRAGRSKPGLLRQHLTAVNAATEICGATTDGAELGATELRFVPGAVQPDTYIFDIGSAGACSLVLQTVLLPLLLAPARSKVKIDGGTHNQAAPPFEFLQHAFLPLLARMGAKVDLELVRHGFYPAGGGRIVADVHPTPKLTPLSLVARGPVTEVKVRAICSALAGSIGRREVVTVCKELGLPLGAGHVFEVPDPRGPGNLCQSLVAWEGGATVLTSFGERGKRAEAVAAELAAATQAFLKAEVPVDEHLADQLLLPLALAGEGELLTGMPTDHTTTNAAVIRAMLGVEIGFRPEGDRCRILVGPAARGEARWDVAVVG